MNPFMRFKNMEIISTDSFVDTNYNGFKKSYKKQYVAEKLKIFGLGGSGLCAPLIATSYLTNYLPNHPSQIYLAIAGITLTVIGGYNAFSEKKEEKKLQENIAAMNKYSSPDQNCLYKKMYTEFEEHLENGKKLVDNLVKAGVVAASSIGIAMLTQYNSLKVYAIGLAIGCGIYATEKVLEHFGEKKAIERIECMLYEE